MSFSAIIRVLISGTVMEIESFKILKVAEISVQE